MATTNSLNNTSSPFNGDNLNFTGHTLSASNTNGTLAVNSNGTGNLTIGTNATAHSTTVGSTTASATTVIQGPAGGVSMTGVAGTAVANLNLVTINTSTGQIGSQASVAVSAWNDVTGTSTTMVKANGYMANNAALVTLTMPSVASSTFGDTIKVGGFGAGGWLIQCVATQLIHFGSTATSAAGSIASTNQYDQIELVASPTTNEWVVRYAVGNLTVV